MPRPDARGSVLPVVLILQGALLLLALGATQSSLLELMMGDNELYRLRALTAAESAVAAGLAALATTAAGTVPTAQTGMTIVGMPGDACDFSLRDGGDDARLLQLSGGTRVGHHYTIAATGRSLRGAEAHIEFGVRIVRDAAGTLLAVEREYWLRRDID